MQSKQEQLEKIVTGNTSIKELKTPEQFAEFERLVKQSNESFDSEREITKLVNQINDLKQTHDQDLNTNSDMYTAMQAKLVTREEVCYGLMLGNQSPQTPNIKTGRSDGATETRT